MHSKNISHKLKLICMNFLQYVIYMLFSLVAIPALSLYVAVMSLFSERRRTLELVRRLIGYWAMGISLLTLPFVKISCKLDNGPEKSGPRIYVCNHRSFLDGFLVAHPCWRYESVQVVNIWPFHIPIIGVIARAAGYLNVNAMEFEDFSKNAKSMIEDGVSIVTFPEGTRSKDNNTGPFHSSMFRIALETGCPIVPICITGNEIVLRRGNIMLRPGTIKIHELPEVQVKGDKDMTPFKLKSKIREMIIRELSVMEDCI
jgi:1-acyl-sn-glycerol-3-phosphate acyltransferase